MCLIALAWLAHDDYPLIVAGNRDEFFARPTASAAWWRDEPNREALLAGRDLQAGGTWMGVTRNGRFAALTNYRDPRAQRPDAPSRGALVGAFVTSDRAPRAALHAIADGAARFNGFNLLAAQWHPVDGPPAMWIVSQPGPPDASAVSPGVHALSNARLDTSWPKVGMVTERTAAILRESVDRASLVDALFAMLADRTIADDDRLPRTGVPLATERALSAPFIRMPGYGTRSSTVFVGDRRGVGYFVERRFEPDAPVDERVFEFDAVLNAARAS